MVPTRLEVHSVYKQKSLFSVHQISEYDILISILVPPFSF